MGNIIEGFGKYFVSPLLHGKFGKYKGKDQYFGHKNPERMAAMGQRGMNKLSDFLGQGKGQIDTGFGIGQQLSDLGIDEKFDPTSAASLGEALARREYEDVYQAEVDKLTSGVTTTVEDSALFDEQYATGVDWDLDYDAELELRDDAAENYWNEWYDANQWTEGAKGYTLSKGDLAGLDVGAKEWRDIANPLQRESTDLLRSSLGNIFSGAGGLKTGSSLRRREEAFQKHGAQQLDIAQGIRGKRQQRADTLAKQLYKAFGDTA